MSKELVEKLKLEFESLKKEVASTQAEIKKLEADIEQKKRALALLNALLAYKSGKPIPTTLFVAPKPQPAISPATSEIPARSKVGKAVYEVLKEANGAPLTIKQIIDRISAKQINLSSKSPYRSVHMALKPLIWRGLVEKLSRSNYRAVVEPPKES